MDHTITLTEEQRHEVACSIKTQIRRIETRLHWQARKTLQGGGRTNAKGEPIDIEKERSIYAKREERCARLREILKIFDNGTDQH